MMPMMLLWYFQSQQMTVNWPTILMTSIVMVGSILVNALVVGVYIGKYQQKQKEQGDDIQELKPLVNAIKSAFEAYTGRVINGADWRK